MNDSPYTITSISIRFEDKNLLCVAAKQVKKSFSSFVVDAAVIAARDVIGYDDSNPDCGGVHDEAQTSTNTIE